MRRTLAEPAFHSQPARKPHVQAEGDAHAEFFSWFLAATPWSCAAGKTRGCADPVCPWGIAARNRIDAAPHRVAFRGTRRTGPWNSHLGGARKSRGANSRAPRRNTP